MKFCLRKIIDLMVYYYDTEQKDFLLKHLRKEIHREFAEVIFTHLKDDKYYLTKITKKEYLNDKYISATYDALLPEGYIMDYELLLEEDLTKKPVPSHIYSRYTPYDEEHI